MFGTGGLEESGECAKTVGPAYAMSTGDEIKALF
jgi:hypothetical protein